MAVEIGWGYPSTTKEVEQPKAEELTSCLLYTSDAADEL